MRKTNFSVLTHNEPEIFRLLDQLTGQNIFITDDWSAPEYYEQIKAHPSRPTVLRRALNKNFAEQRNFIHQFIPEGEWVITIDADETYDFMERFLGELAWVDTEAFRMARRNITQHPDGTETVLDETHVRGFHNHPERIFWKEKLHEYPFGFNDCTMLPTATVLHVKSSARCAIQHEFYCSFPKEQDGNPT